MTSKQGIPVPFREGVRTATIPARILGMQLTTTMTVLRLHDDQLLLYSPVEMTPACKEAVQALGTVAHLYAPNLFHHLYLKEWADAFPDAKVHAPKGLDAKNPDVRISRIHSSEPEADFEGVVEEIAIRGFRLKESVLVHRPSATLLVADLVHNIGRPQHSWTKLYTSLMGFYDRVALSRMIRWTSFQDLPAARSSLHTILEQPFQHLIVGHGDPVEETGKESLREACGWML